MRSHPTRPASLSPPTGHARTEAAAAPPRRPRGRRAGAALLGLALLNPCLHAALNVVCTTPDLAALARAVGGEQVVLTTLARPTEDPHFVDPKPSFIVKLNRADALIEGGAELELGWLPSLLEGARNAQLAPGAVGRIVAAPGLPLLEIPTALDRAKGDVHAAGNPHFLMDPVLARAVAERLRAAFARLDPSHAAAFEANAARFTAALDAKRAAWQQRLAPFAGTRLVAYHNTWPYFAQRFGLRIDLFLEPKPGLPPTPSHLASVIGTMKTERLRAILVEPYQSRRTAETVAAETGARILSLTQYPGGVKGTEAGYLELMEYLVATVAGALEGTAP